jgi:hypothetical protein
MNPQAPESPQGSIFHRSDSVPWWLARDHPRHDATNAGLGLIFGGGALWGVAPRVGRLLVTWQDHGRRGVGAFGLLLEASVALELTGREPNDAHEPSSPPLERLLDARLSMGCKRAASPSVPRQALPQRQRRGLNLRHSPRAEKVMASGGMRNDTSGAREERRWTRLTSGMVRPMGAEMIHGRISALGPAHIPRQTLSGTVVTVWGLAAGDAFLGDAMLKQRQPGGGNGDAIAVCSIARPAASTPKSNICPNSKRRAPRCSGCAN